MHGLAVLRHTHAGSGRVAGAELVLGGQHLHLEFMQGAADLELRHAELERGPGQIHQSRGGLVVTPFTSEGLPPLDRRAPAPGEEGVPGHFVEATSHGHHAHEHIGRPALGLGDGQLDGGVVAGERHDLGVDHTFSLDRHQHGGFTKGHAHLQARGFAGLVLLLLGQHVHAVVVVLREPELALFGDPHGGGRLGGMALRVLALGNQLDLTGLFDGGLAQKQPAVVGGAAADLAQLLDFGAVVVRIEAAHDAFAGADLLSESGHHLDGLALQRLARGVHRQGLELDLPPVAGPGACLDAHQHVAGPQRHFGGGGLHLAIGVVEAQLGPHRHGLCDGGQLGQHHLGRALPVGDQGHAIGDQAPARQVVVIALIGAVCSLCVVARRGGARRDLARRAEAELVVGIKAHPALVQDSTHARTGLPKGTAREVVHLHTDGQVLGRHQGAFGWAQARLDHGQAELLHPESAAGHGPLATPILAHEVDLIHAQLGLWRDLPAGQA